MNRGIGGRGVEAFASASAPRCALAADPRAQFALRADPPDAVRGRQKTALRCAGRHNSGPRACKSLQALGATPSDWQSLRVDYLRIGADQCNRIRRFRAMRVEGRYMLFGERLIELMGMTR